jgi:hypothetical protein
MQVTLSSGTAIAFAPPINLWVPRFAIEKVLPAVQDPLGAISGDDASAAWSVG